MMAALRMQTGGKVLGVACLCIRRPPSACPVGWACLPLRLAWAKVSVHLCGLGSMAHEPRAGLIMGGGADEGESLKLCPGEDMAWQSVQYGGSVS